MSLNNMAGFYDQKLNLGSTIYAFHILLQRFISLFHCKLTNLKGGLSTHDIIASHSTVVWRWGCSQKVCSPQWRHTAWECGHQLCLFCAPVNYGQQQKSHAADLETLPNANIGLPYLDEREERTFLVTTEKPKWIPFHRWPYFQVPH